MPKPSIAPFIANAMQELEAFGTDEITFGHMASVLNVSRVAVEVMVERGKLPIPKRVRGTIRYWSLDELREPIARLAAIYKAREDKVEDIKASIQAEKDAYLAYLEAKKRTAEIRLRHVD